MKKDQNLLTYLSIGKYQTRIMENKRIKQIIYHDGRYVQ